MKKLNRTSSVLRSSRLSSYSKVALGPLAAASAAGSAEAAIVYFDVNPDRTFNMTEALYFGSINLGTGTYALNNTDGTAFGLRFDDDGAGGLFAGLNAVSPGSYVQWGGGVYIERLALNASIDEFSVLNWSPVPPMYLFYGYVGGLNGNWAFGPNETQSGFAPLRIFADGGLSYYYGWVEVTVVSGDTSSPPYAGAVGVTVTGFAFENQINTAILAGDTGGGPGPAPVPEPGTMAVGAGLFALAVGAHLRRRREKKAAASDALLNLAAGARGLEKFRADKAA
jgi:hypothetical protein